MEALAAVSLASNVLHFLEFMSKIIREAREIQNSVSGTTKEFEDLDKTCELLGKISQSLIPKLSPDELRALPPNKQPIDKEIRLAETALQCKEASDTLRRDLQSLKVKSTSRWRASSLRQSAKNWAISRPQVKILEKTVEDARANLMLSLQDITSEKQSSILRYLDEVRSTGLNLIHDHSKEFEHLTKLVDKISSDVRELNKPRRYTPDSLSQIIEELSKVSTACGRHWVAEHGVVETLYYETLSVRHSAIPEAHKETLKWLFIPEELRVSSAACPKPTILDWLQSGEGIYWVSGKPGSGKSTLMKFMGDNPKVHDALQKWSGKSQCVTAAYYFWNAGTPLQKSVEGLLRSLLFDILAKNPELIPVAAPKRWEAMKDQSPTPLLSVIGGNLGRSWTIPEMIDALDQLSSTPHVTKRFCLFVDGLDEYSGDHRDLIKLIKTLAGGRNFKLCVSSRPWNVFEDALGLDARKKLYVHELTRNDIQRYIASTLEENMHWRAEAARDRRYRNLTVEITDRAHGVFLWVSLVVKSVQEGLTNGDSIGLLEQRMRALPTELGPFFRHTLHSIPAIYHIRMALYFRVALEAPEPPALILYSFFDDHFDQGSDSLELPDSRGSPKLDFKAEITNRLPLARRRLNARSKGLLESHPTHSHVGSGLDDKVMFLHRTVRDFLVTPEMTSFLDNILASCHVNTVVLGAYSKLIKLQPTTSPHGELVRGAMFYGGRAEKEHPNQAVELLTAISFTVPDLATRRERSEVLLDYVFCNGLAHYAKYHTRLRSLGFESRHQLLGLAIQARGKKLDGGSSDNISVVEGLLQMGTRVRPETWARYISDDRSFVSPKDSEREQDEFERGFRMFELLIFNADDVNVIGKTGDVVWGCRFQTFVQDMAKGFPLTSEPLRSRLQILHMLFTYGASPNAPFKGTTIWAWFSSHVRGIYSVSAAQLDPIATITEILLKAGADCSHGDALTMEDVSRIFPPRLADAITQEIWWPQERAPQLDLNVSPAPATTKSWVSWATSWIWKLPN
ncbi:hypothetical protein OQA88_9009 [Cercophora sp. LCS_1]